MTTDAITHEWPEYWITIRRTLDGVEREARGGAAWHSSTVFYWSEGNGSCDCNRELAFRRAGGEVLEPSDVTCGDSRYEIAHLRFPDGTIVPWKDACERDALEQTL